VFVSIVWQPLGFPDEKMALGPIVFRYPFQVLFAHFSIGKIPAPGTEHLSPEIWVYILEPLKKRRVRRFAITERGKAEMHIRTIEPDRTGYNVSK